MDEFYASVEQRDDPRLRGKLRGKPVIVAWKGSVRLCAPLPMRPGFRCTLRNAGEAGRATVSRCGLHRSGFHQVSRCITRSAGDLQTPTDLIEPLSLDEAYLDATTNKTGLPTATLVARTIREQIRQELISSSQCFGTCCSSEGNQRQLYKLAAANRIPSFKIGHRCDLIRRLLRLAAPKNVSPAPSSVPCGTSLSHAGSAQRIVAWGITHDREPWPLTISVEACVGSSNYRHHRTAHGPPPKAHTATKFPSVRKAGSRGSPPMPSTALCS
jgi:hypothetical protein